MGYAPIDLPTTSSALESAFTTVSGFKFSWASTAPTWLESSYIGMIIDRRRWTVNLSEIAWRKLYKAPWEHCNFKQMDGLERQKSWWYFANHTLDFGTCVLDAHFMVRKDGMKLWLSKPVYEASGYILDNVCSQCQWV